ncbi:hemolysin [candidate division KSB3 bacterium]|uniref:Hemolysin n=1 Tax=candidate division KSB3 bacterium TaxID=2044937 RepID=A0A2G6E540_9BACT|nr:MAG: hemolysin [candidate division KSB3 bacterium]PIE29814.1 MAG: hemolysin [candidate division KSB3 bacterium]
MEFFVSSFILLLFLLMCSAFFSGSETAMFSLNAIRLQRLEKEGATPAARIVSNFLKHPSKLLVTILIGNEVVNIFASSTAASFCVRFFGERFGPIIATAGMTILLLIFGEVTPKTFAVQFPMKYAFFVSRPLQFFSKIVFPVRAVLTSIADAILRLIGGSRKSHERLLTGQEFRTLLTVSEREGVVVAAEKKMIDNLFDFSEMTVKEIMIPRTDMLCFSLDDSFADILEKCRSELHARVPVYEGMLDNIAGVVYVKDLLPVIQKEPEDFTLRDVLREAYFIPESKKVQELLKDFQAKKIHIAIVVDEYGGTSGLVCLEDILEEIVGDISDEFDKNNLPWCVTVEEGRRYRVNAMMHIHEFNQEFHTDFSQEFYGTVSGLFLHESGRIPRKGDTVTIEDLRLTVSKLRNIRILEVLVEREPLREKERP